MAIKIPSKNIYEMNNPKIRDNLIDNVSVKNKVITLLQGNNTNIANFEHQTGFVAREKKTKYNEEDHPLDGILTRSFVSLQPFYYDSEISFSKLLKNGYIKEVYDKLNTQNKNSISCNIVFKIITTQYKGSNVNSDGLTNANLISEEEKNGYGEIPSLKVDALEEFRNSDLYEGIGAIDTVTLSATNETNLSEISIDYNQENDTYSFKPIVLCGFEKEWAYFYQYNNVITGDYRRLAYGGKTYYKPEQISITLNGDVVNLDIKDGSVPYGSGNKPHSLSGNELLQDNGFVTLRKENIEVRIGGELSSDSGSGVAHLEMFSSFNFSIGDNVEYNGETARINRYYEDDGYYDIISTLNGNFYNSQQKSIIVTSEQHIIKETLHQYLANNVLAQYAKGKETATLLCDISDYYNESGEKEIDIKTENMSFRLHDEVIPYIFGANGQDQPMSKKQDGTAKVFEVVGSNIIYDGAVWQELTLLEKK